MSVSSNPKRRRVSGNIFHKQSQRRQYYYRNFTNCKRCNSSTETDTRAKKEQNNRNRSDLSDLDDIECYFNERKSNPDIPQSPFLFSIQEKCLNNYLKCEVNRWKYPKSSREKVQLEPLPTEFLPRIKATPLLIPVLRGDHMYPAMIIQKVCGYRELYKKRMYIQYLKDLEEEISCIATKEALQRKQCSCNTGSCVVDIEPS